MTHARLFARALLRTALLLLAALSVLAGCNAVTWQRSNFEGRLRAAGIVSRERAIGQDTVRYWIGGRGTPVVLVHGFGANALWQWTEQAPELARAHRVVMPDLLWFGDSDSVDRDFRVEHQVAALGALLHELGIENADLVGLSYGGIVAYEFAAAHPEQVRRLVLVDTPGRAFTRDDYQGLLTRFHTDDFADVLVPSSERDVRALIELAYEHPPWTPDWALTQTLEGLFASNRGEQAALLRSMISEIDGLGARPGAVRAPTLVLWGRNDPIFPLALGQRLASGLGARIEVIEDARHFPNAEHPREFNRALTAFLDAP